MKKLLATTAVVTMAFAGAASAQSVLERVLSEIDNSTNLASVNGTFANIAENLGGAGAVTVYTNASGGDVITQAEYDAAALEVYGSAYSAVSTSDYVDPSAGTTITAAEWGALSTADQAAYETGFGATDYYVDASGSVITTTTYTNLTASNPYTSYTSTVVAVAGLAGVNGSINNALDGVTSAIVSASQVATAGTTTAYQFDLPTFNLGALSTTALGAVNTGDITLGVNSTVDDAKTSSTQAVSSVMSQLGGSADTGAIVLNVASNMTGVNGSINNTMANVNGAMVSASTTALGAVNTGTIVSGVNAAVQGITGTSGQSNGTGTADTTAAAGDGA